MIAAENTSWPAITSEDAKNFMSSLLRKGVHDEMYQVSNSGEMISSEEEPSSSKLPNNVAAFLVKLWTLVNDQKTDNIVCWSMNGKSFIIKNQTHFEKELLPYYYKHNHMASFVRQLNMYGFHKKVSAELGGLKCDKDEMEFAHEYFRMGQPSLLIQIKRKIANNKNQSQDTAASSLKPELMTKMLTEVRGLQGRQEQFDYKLALMKNENTLLWKEFMVLRQKHLHQQEIVNKLIHFLVTLVQSRRGGLTVKRRVYPLMIDNSSRPRKKSKLSEPQASPTGPVIHELYTSEPGLESEYIVANMLENEEPVIESPESVNEYAEIPLDNETKEAIKLSHSGITQYNAFNQSIAAAEKRVAAKTEELHLLEMPDDRETSPGTTITVLNNESIGSKPIPVDTVRSSKLAAMVANMKKSQEDIDQELDAEISVNIDDDISDNDSSSPVNFEDFLTDTDEPNNDNIRNNIENKTNAGRRPSKAKKGFDHIYGGKSVLKSSNNRNQHDKNVATKSTYEKKPDYDKASTSSSEDLSLSCVNSSGVSDTYYREELGNDLESMQAQLDNIHDVLRGDGYKIDANTLFGLFNNDESISFGIPDLPLPINPELDPEVNCEREVKEDHFQTPESENGLNRGEVMTYSSNMIDFDHLLSGEDPSFPLLIPETTNADSMLNSDPLNLDDDKTLFLDNCLKKDMNSRS